MIAARIVSPLVYDTSCQFCARNVDVIVPSSWDDARIAAEARRRLPSAMAMADPDMPIDGYELDSDPVFADWREPLLGQIDLFAEAA